MIYIPLCFYFIDARRIKIWSYDFIYIPLCFYFIWYGNIHIVPLLNLHSTMLLLYRFPPLSICISIIFTFHYASTLSSISSSSRLCIAWFTFHYASTLSSERLSEFSSSFSFTFHYASTLSFAQRSLCAVCTLIYIPLCFYFIIVQLLAHPV